MSNQSAIEIIAELLTIMSIEQIAVAVDKSVATIHKWKKGKSNPSKGDYELLVRLNVKVV